jgi:hypothetical protein
MRDLARRPEEDRRDLFRAAAQAMRVHEAIVEKDFWVCWVLDYLFHDSPWKTHMAFKGGTSLSKAFHAIERFSEDIDLVLDWRLLDYSEDGPWEDRSNAQKDAFGKEAIRRATAFLAEKLTPVLRRDLSDRVGAAVEVQARGEEVGVRYPRAFPLPTIRPMIQLEIGPLAAWTPNEDKEIRPYAAERFPQHFSQPSTTVRTLLVERTFWEKATILHREAQRTADRPLPPRYSRHYYDLYRLNRPAIRDRALSRLDLLRDVVEFKTRFYRCAWAKYEDAKPGSLRLLPPARNMAELSKDYRDMQGMLFGTVPTFDEIIAGVAALEKAINELR